MQPYLTFNGNCAAAFAFYALCLDGKITMSMTYGQTPQATEAPPEQKDKIMHARIEANGFTLMGSDVPSHAKFEGFKGFSLSVPIKDPAQGEKVFKALATGGTITMPYAPTFWAKGFGMLTDQFGVPWMVNCE